MQTLHDPPTRERAPRTIHLLVRRKGGGTETNIGNLCEVVEHFEYIAMEDTLGFPLRFSRLPRLIRELRARRPEVVFCYGITTHLVATLAWPRRGPALVGNVRCVTDFSGAKRWLMKLIEHRFTAWVSNSRAALADGRKGYVIYNGVRTPPADEAPLLPGLAKPVLGIVARGHAKKGHDFFLELWKRLGRPGTLVFAGELGPDLKARAEAEGVLCPGFVPAGPMMRSLDLLLVPSTAEGLPTVALEAMARGVPVLATPAGGTGELVKHERTGFLLERDKWEAFLRHADWSNVAEVGERGRRYVRQHFSLSRMTREFEFVAMEAARRARR